MGNGQPLDRVLHHVVCKHHPRAEWERRDLGPAPWVRLLRLAWTVVHMVARTSLVGEFAERRRLLVAVSGRFDLWRKARWHDTRCRDQRGARLVGWSVLDGLTF